jgi:bacteriophage lambda ninG protein
MEKILKSVKVPQVRLNDFYDILVGSFRENTIIPSRIKYKDVKASKAFEGAKKILLEAENDYITKFQNGEVSKIKSGRYAVHNNSADILINEDYKWFYNKFRTQNSTTNVVNELLDISNKKCIYCESRHGNAELDHFLPESEYDYLTIVPANLLPSCSKCNKRKSSNVEEIYHPYFADVSEQIYIKCEIEIHPKEKDIDFINLSNSDLPNILIPKYYLVAKSTVNNKILYDQIKVVFEKLDLPNRYSEMMAEIFDEEINELKEILLNTDKEELKNNIEIKIRSRSNVYSENSCIIPFYKSLLSFMEKSPSFVNVFNSLQ